MVEKTFLSSIQLVVVNAHILHNKTSRKKMSLEIVYEKSLKDCSLLLVLIYKCKVRPAVQLADLLGETIFYIGFQRHMLRWRELLSTHVVYMHREASARPGKL